MTGGDTGGANAPVGRAALGGPFLVVAGAGGARAGHERALRRAARAHDVDVSIAHVHGLEDAGLLTSDDTAALAEALTDVGSQIADGAFRVRPADEDVHSAIERAVTDRSVTWGPGCMRDAVGTTSSSPTSASGCSPRAGASTDDNDAHRTLVARAREHADTVMPGTTHARAAQTVTLGHHLLAHAWALLRDLERVDQWAIRASTSPLGAGALATSTLGLDPAAAAARLGFARAFENSIDACPTGTSCRSSSPTRRSARRTCRGWRPTSPGGPTPRWAGRSSTRPTRPVRASCRRSGTPIPRSSRVRRPPASPPASPR